MLDEMSLARLAEMGIDVYVPRARAASGSVPAAAPAHADAADRAAARPPAAVAGPRVLLVAQAAQAESKLLADVVRALRFARIDGVAAHAGLDTADGALDGIAGLVLFGDALARTIGAALPAQRQRELAWVVTGDASVLARDARAKRALWSELRRTARALGASVRG